MQLVKNLPAMRRTWSIPGSGSSPGEGIGYPFQYFWASLVGQMVKKIHLQCGRPEFDPWVGTIRWRRAWQPTPVFLPGESPWTEEPGGLQSMGSQRVGHDWATKHSSAQSMEEGLKSLRCNWLISKLGQSWGQSQFSKREHSLAWVFLLPISMRKLV